MLLWRLAKNRMSILIQVMCKRFFHFPEIGSLMVTTHRCAITLRSSHLRT